MDDGFYFPSPPAGTVMPHGAQLAVNVAFLLATGGFIAWGAFQWIRTGRPVILMLLIGGLLASFNEPVVNALGLIWHAREGQWTAYRALGPVPTWTIPLWVTCQGGLIYPLFCYIRRGPTANRLWAAFAFLVLTNIALEMPILFSGVYEYYGEPPMEAFGLPVYWPFLNMPALLVIAALMHRVPEMFIGRGIWLLAILPALVYAALSASLGLPIFSSLHAPGMSTMAKWLLGAISIAMSLLVVSALSRFVTRRFPFIPESDQEGAQR
ncbi:hypothetical protein ACGFNU_15795 [Spirillospora sp. NPDC048911]|uniref:hypothetical protein n=1 Tax=Spirillospora sp. NPDC048911 TaxID=3364527 RepID=UPI003712A8F2